MGTCDNGKGPETSPMVEAMQKASRTFDLFETERHQLEATQQQHRDALLIEIARALLAIQPHNNGLRYAIQNLSWVS